MTFQPRVNSNSAATARLAITTPESQLPVEQRCGQAIIVRRTALRGVAEALELLEINAEDQTDVA